MLLSISVSQLGERFPLLAGDSPLFTLRCFDRVIRNLGINMPNAVERGRQDEKVVAFKEPPLLFALCRAWLGVAYAVAVIGGSEVGFCAAVERPVNYRDRRRGRSRIVTSENLANLPVSMDGCCECFQ